MRSTTSRGVVTAAGAGTAAGERRQQTVHVRLDVEDEEAQRGIERRADVGAIVLDVEAAAKPREAPAAMS